jgi:hypothetical protein
MVLETETHRIEFQWRRRDRLLLDYHPCRRDGVRTAGREDTGPRETVLAIDSGSSTHARIRIGRLLFRAVQHTLVDRELDSLRRRPRAEVIHPRLQPLLPPVEMHARQLTERRALQMNVQALALADEGTPVRSEIQHLLL